MSATEEEKEQTVAEGEQEEASGEHAKASHEPMKPGTWRFVIPLVAFFIGFVSLFFVGWVIFPLLLYAEKEQPIDFNHKLHVEELGECESCHYFREDGSFSGVPNLANCRQCHEEAVGESPEEAKLVQEYVEPGKEIPWLIYARQPQCVFFSHVAHVKMAEMECITCHGPIGESDHMKPYEYNRLTKYSRDIWGWNIAGFKKNSWDRMKMDDCAECHEKMTGHRGTCFQCHK
jgi:hypothetical protein